MFVSCFLLLSQACLIITRWEVAAAKSPTLCCSFYDGFLVLRGNIVNNISSVRFVAHQQHFQLLDTVDQKRLEATRQQVLGFLFAFLASVGHKDLTLESSSNHVNTLGFCQFCLILTYQSDWCLMNFLVPFLMILGFTRGLREVMVLQNRWQAPCR